MLNKLALLFLMIIPFVVNSQNNEAKRFEEIVKKLEEKKYLEALLLENRYIDYFFHPDAMIFNRAITLVNLGDIPSAIADFKKVPNTDFFADKQEIIKYYTDKEYVATIESSGYLGKCKPDPSNNYRPIPTRSDSLIGGRRHERDSYNVYFYDLQISLEPKKKFISGKSKIYFKVVEATDRIQVDLHKNMEVMNVLWNADSLIYTRDQNSVFINFPAKLKQGSTHEITIEYSGKPLIALNPPWNGGFVWKKKEGKPWIGVACEHLGGNIWWPTKSDLTDKPDSVCITVDVPAKLTVVSNGVQRYEKEKGKKRKEFQWFVSYPITNYNVTVYAGKFVSFQLPCQSGKNTIPMDFYVFKSTIDKAKPYYSKTGDIIKTFEELFGEFPFPKDGVAMVEAPFVGMEHQTAIAIGDMYNNNYNRDYGVNDYDFLVVHETAHEWWGNSVSMADMADAWINEGFATYAELLFLEKRYGYNKYLHGLKTNNFEIVNLWPMSGPRGINDMTFLSGDIYRKGATMLNNLRCIMDNDSLFFRLIKDFAIKYKYKTVTTDDFTGMAEEYSKLDLHDFFQKYLFEAELPVLEYSFMITENGTELSYRWKDVGKNFSMPFLVSYGDSGYVKLTAGTDIKKEFLPAKNFHIVNFSQFDTIVPIHNSCTYFWTHYSTSLK